MMLKLTQDYFRQLSDEIGSGWNHFWYSPQSGRKLVWLRQLVALFALIWLASFSPDLTAMFSQTGWLSKDVVHQATTNGNLNHAAPGASHLFLMSSQSWLWLSHAICLLVVCLATLGIAVRLTTPLSLLVVLAYVHRAPMVTGAFETVLCTLLLYLSLGPKENVSSLLKNGSTPTDEPNWVNNLVIRLIQVHLCAFYLLIAASKLGTPDWWSGAAIWYLLTDTQHRLVHVSFLTTGTRLAGLCMDAIAHGWVAFELFFPALIWIPRLRPLLLAVATIVWLCTAAVTGQIGYCLLMAMAVWIFADRWR